MYPSQVAGALYVSNVASVRLTRCQFEQNAASDGGAIYIWSSSDIQLTDCTFGANSAVNGRMPSYASRGGAIYSDSSRLQLVDTSFSDNVAVYSGSALYAGNAGSLSLIRCVFTETRTPPPTPCPDNTILSLFARGPIESAAAVIKLADCRIESKLQTNHSLLNVGGPTSVSNSTVSCQTNAATAMALHHASLPAADYTASYQLEQISVWTHTSCPAGYYAPPVTNAQCQLTLHGRLADLNDTSVTRSCYACPAHAHCDAGVARVDYNYFARTVNGGRIDPVLCPAGYCQGTNTSSGSVCSAGRAGVGCTGCEDDHVMSLHFAGYVTCESRDKCVGYSSASAVIICFSVFYVIVLLLLLRLTTPRASPTDAHVTAARSLIGFLFPLVFFHQLLPSVYPRLMTSTWWPDRIVQFSTSLFNLYPAGVFSGFCLDAFSDSPSSSAAYFITVSLYWSQLVLIILLFVAFSAIFLSSRGPFTEQNIKMLVSCFLPAFLLFQLFSNVPLLRSSLQAVHCVTSYNASSTLFNDALTGCYSAWQVFAIIYTVVCVAPLCLVIDSAAFLLSRARLSVPSYVGLCLFPVLGLLVVPLRNIRAAARMDHPERDEFDVDETTPPGLRSVRTHIMVIVQAVVIKPFSSYWSSKVVDVGWMGVILLRNFVICLLATLLQHEPTVRAVLVTGLCLSFTVDHVVCRGGYTLSAARRLETAVWIMLSLLSAMDIYAAVVYEAGLVLSRGSAVDWVARIIALLPVTGVVVVVVVLLIRRLLRCSRQTRQF